MKPTFWIVNTVMVVWVFVLWRLGILVGLTDLPEYQVWMMLMLFGLFLIGMGFAFFRRWQSVVHIANGLPMVGLLFTGLGIVDAIAGFTSISDSASLAVFRGVGLALPVNFEAVFLMWWLRELCWWDGDTNA